MRTDDEINAEIRKLQLALDAPRRWNDKTREALNESIRVLRERMTPGQVEQHYYIDETSSEFTEGDNDLWTTLDRVARWLKGETGSEAPSEEL